mgnify:CR=1 FL=1
MKKNMDSPLSVDKFIDRIMEEYTYAKENVFDNIEIVVETAQNTYCIKAMEDGFQCDTFDIIFEDLAELAEELYEEIHEEIWDIRIE